MRKLSADYIFPVSSEPIKNGVVTVDDEGTVLEVTTDPDLQNGEIERFEGIICPGFINTHCHLELSHLRSHIPENTGMTEFIKEIISKRGAFSEHQMQEAIIEAEAEMMRNGIVAVGDISNTSRTFQQKANGNLYYHTFVEVFDLNPGNADEVFENAALLEKQFGIKQLPVSITPHAPYSVSDKLFELVYAEAVRSNSLISIHNQESEEENELFVSKTGVMFDAFSQMGINMDFIEKTGLNSLLTTLPKLPLSQKTLLVHNTYTTRQDIEYAQGNSSTVFWCTCPNANIYIEGKLPNYNYFIDTNARVTIGTDSLASNWSLSVLDELKAISTYYSKIPLQTLLLWATKNGADFLGVNRLGSIEKGKTPGINLLRNVKEFKITEKTEVQRLV